MERRLIRKRWQVTIPKGIRQQLNLFEGQLLNFEIIEEHGAWEIIMFAGSSPRVEEMAAFKNWGARRDRKIAAQKKAAGNFRKSDIKAMQKAIKILAKFKMEGP